MRLTAHTDFSLRVLIRLALRPADLATIAEIAALYGISEHHLTKVVHELGGAGYVETVRGRGGGLRLAKSPAQIGVGDVVRRMEPDLRIVACLRDAESCRIAPACELSTALGRALSAFMAELDRYTLADLVAKPRRIGRLLGVEPAEPIGASD